MSELSQKRLLAELVAINERYPEMTLRSHETPTFEGTIEVDGDAHHIRLTLPPRYPGVPPVIRELDPETGQEMPPRGRANRLVDRGLCLFPHGNDPQAWRQDRLAVEALDRFRIFIRDEREQTGLHRARAKLFVPSGMLGLLVELGPGRLHVRRAEAGGDLFATAVSFDRDSSLDYRQLDPKWEAVLSHPIEIPWVVLTTDKPWPELAGSRELLDETLRDQLPTAIYQRHRSTPWLVLVRKAQAGSDAEPEIACVHRPLEHLTMLLELDVIEATPSERLFHRVDGIVTDRDALATETIVIVGLGSLGSALALSLARAGMRRFVLIDPDALSIENVCRHIGTLRDLGRLKVDIVRDAITSVNPDAEVETISKWLAWDLPWLSAGTELEALFADGKPCTVVSTCADGIVERQLNALAVQRRVPAIYASALGAAEHGRIFRVLPERTPCLECILAAQDGDESTYPRFISPGLGSEQPPPYVDPGLPGLGIDVTQIALIAARFTLQTVAEVRAVELGLPSEVGHHLLWTNRGGWLFDRSLQLIVEHFPRLPSCPTCGASTQAEVFEESEQEKLQSLLAKMQAKVP